MRNLSMMAALALATLTAPVSAQPQGGSGTAPAVPNYTKGSNWLCLPGRTDVCSKPLPTNALIPW